MEQLIAKIKAFIKDLNDRGIPTPIMRDMISGKPSITYTMLLVSFALTVLSSFKLGANTLGLNFDQCLQLLGYVGIGYIGRKYQKGDVTIEGKEGDNK
jgi:hypothetical protein